jgi:Putative peptidoglycan binding domain
VSLEIPGATRYSQSDGDQGADVYGIQRGLNRCGLFGEPIVSDGDFGAKTHNRVVRYQQRRGLHPDGVVGPKTSTDLSQLLQGQVIEDKRLPRNLTYAIARLESGNLYGAVNWEVAGGVDCAIFQRRVYGPPYDAEAIKRAYDASYQAALLANTLRGRHDLYYPRSGYGSSSHERSWRLGALYHNYPYAAETLSKTKLGNLSSYWTTPQTWVIGHNRKFEDGAQVRTPLEWCQHYALGASAHDHEGVAVRGVIAWHTP